MLHAIGLKWHKLLYHLLAQFQYSIGFAASVHVCEACSCLLANVTALTEQPHGVRSIATSRM